MFVRLLIAGAGLCSVLALACSSSEATPEPSADMDTAGTNAKSTLDVCGFEPLVIGHKVSGPLLEVTLLDLQPAPPFIYANEWQVEIRDVDGKPVEDVAAIAVDAFMPAPQHQHYSRSPPQLTQAAAAGTFQLNMNLHMEGGWELRFKSVDAQDSADYWTTVYACVSEGE